MDKMSIKNNLVTKTYFKTTLDRAFEINDKKWRQIIKQAFQENDKKWDVKLNKNKEELIKATTDFMNDSIIPILDRIEDRLDTMNNRVNKHDDKLEIHDRKLYDHDSRIGSLEKTAVL